jgi:hypothetical protein
LAERKKERKKERERERERWSEKERGIVCERERELKIKIWGGLEGRGGREGWGGAGGTLAKHG